MICQLTCLSMYFLSSGGWALLILVSEEVVLEEVSAGDQHGVPSSGEKIETFVVVVG